MEALIRWNHPELGLLSPNTFIPISEQTGLIIPIGEWVLRTACKQNKTWQDQGFPPMRMAVNLSAKQLENTNIVKQVEDILKETCLDPQYLELEITERIALKEKDKIIQILTTLKNMGIHIAIDDFGTEYSSLTYLKQLPADTIKIDMAFVQGIEKNIKDEAIIKSIIVLAKSMGLNIIAEGVEEKIQHDFLIRELCDEIQGFYYFKPMPLKKFESIFINNL